ncbi:hypothetical protein O181_001684 [Austropuccinia psidii MF-1]|uniref:Uncharacterized protein n=1 Tax=Austropuccinia psidii MF-1 TaxID=1389203 RepID=A0A9Q3BB01_9BASI|nr:hypothetical protein [Austropuccinia psidii MF-1]
MKIQIRNHNLLAQLPGELEHEVNCWYNQSCTLDDLAKILQYVRKKIYIGKFSTYKGNYFREKKPFRTENRDKHRGKLALLIKANNSCHHCGSTGPYFDNFPKAKNKIYAIENFPEEEVQEKDSESDSMGDAIRENSDYYQYPIKEFLVEYQGETKLEIQNIKLEAGIPQDTTNKNLSKHTQDSQTFLVTSTKEMAYIHGKATKMTVCIENSQHSLIIDSGAHCSIVVREYLYKNFPNWEKKHFFNKGKEFQKCIRKYEIH